jgi:membrane-associated phospholipid phosphatase
VSENRVVAGIHYPVDIRAGRFVAYRIFQGIQNVPSIWGGAGWDGPPPQPKSLRGQVRSEFPQYAL